MCPMCIAAAAQIVVSAASSGGAAALVINKFRVKKNAEKREWNESEGRMNHEQESDRAPQSRIAS